MRSFNNLYAFDNVRMIELLMNVHLLTKQLHVLSILTYFTFIYNLNGKLTFIVLDSTT